MTDKTFEFVLPAALRELAMVFAKEHDLSLAQLVRMALREFLKEKKNEL